MEKDYRNFLQESMRFDDEDGGIRIYGNEDKYVDSFYMPTSNLPGDDAGGKYIVTTMVDDDGVEFVTSVMKCHEDKEPKDVAVKKRKKKKSVKRKSGSHSPASEAVHKEGVVFQKPKVPDVYDDIQKCLGEKEPPFKNKLRNVCLEKQKEMSLTDADIYRNAGFAKSTFSKMMNDNNYNTGKEKILAIAITTLLSVEETEDLLNSRGYTLSDSVTSDIIVKCCLNNYVGSLKEVNEILAHFHQKPMF